MLRAGNQAAKDQSGLLHHPTGALSHARCLHGAPGGGDQLQHRRPLRGVTRALAFATALAFASAQETSAFERTLPFPLLFSSASLMVADEIRPVILHLIFLYAHFLKLSSMFFFNYLIQYRTPNSFQMIGQNRLKFHCRLQYWRWEFDGRRIKRKSLWPDTRRRIGCCTDNRQTGSGGDVSGTRRPGRACRPSCWAPRF